MHMIHLLMRNAPIVLQDVVVLDTLCDGDFLRHGQHFRELVVGDIMQFGAVVFGDDQLRRVNVSARLGNEDGE